MGGAVDYAKESVEGTVKFLLNPLGEFQRYASFIFTGPAQTITGRQIREFSVNGGEPFSPLDIPFGPTAPVDGVVDYIGPIKKVKVSTGGKGGNVTTESYQYFADVGISFAQAPPGGIVEFTSLWADVQFVYGQNPDQDESSDEIGLVVVEAKGKTFVDLTSSAAGPNLAKFKKGGADITMTGWATPGNNITANPVSSKKDKSTGISYLRLRVSAADAGGVANEAAGETVTLFQENIKSNLNDLADVELYLGTDVEIASPTIQQNEGDDNVEAMRGVARMVINRLYLNKYGTRVPMSWKAIVKAHESLTLAEAIEALLLRGGLAAEQFDVTGLDGDVQGFTLRAGDSPASMVGALMIAYDLMVREVSGQLVFFHREDAPHVTVAGDDLGAHADDEQGQRELRLERSPALALPAAVLVSFLDPTKDLQQSEARQQIANATTEVAISVNLPIVINPEDARAIAKRLAWMPRAARHEASMGLPPSRQDVVEGDVLDAESHDESWHLVSQRVETGASGVVVVQAQTDNTGVVTAAPAGAGDDDSDSLQVPPPVSLDVMDLPAICEAHVLVPGRYFALALYDTEQPWPGAVVYESKDDGVSFLPVHHADAEAVAGYCSDGALGGGVPAELWDYTNTLQVTIWNGELESVSAEDALALHNLAAARTSTDSWELIVFRNATLLSTTEQGHKVYELDTFLRGLRGTEVHIGSGLDGGAFVMLEQAQFSQCFLSDLNTEKLYKGVPVGGTSSEFSDTDTATLGLMTLKPFAPQLVSFEPAAGILSAAPGITDVTITWRRRTRAFNDPLDPNQKPLTEEVNEFSVDVYVSSVLANTYTVPGGDDGETSWEYTAAEQTADGGGIGDPITVYIYQNSTSVGRGRALGPLG